MDAVAAVSQGLHFGEAYPIGLALAGIAVMAAVGALSHQHAHAFSASVIYLGMGLAAALVITGLNIEWLRPAQDHALLEHLSELAVIVALFGTGLKLERPLTSSAWSGVARLLLVAMPLTIAAAALLGSAATGLSAGAAIILGVAVAPTDPVLAGDIGVGPPGDEEEREPNFSVTGEAGLNDGLGLPFLLLGAYVADRGGTGWFVEWLLVDLVWAVAVAVVVGAGVGYGLASLAVRLRDSELLDPRFDGWLAVAAVLFLYGVTQALAGLGFVAAFVGGVAFRRYEHGHEYNARVHDGAEMVEKFGELAIVLLLGTLVTVDGLKAPGLGGWLLVAAVVLVLRPVAVLVSLLGSGLPARERAWIGWFGVRGIGSLYYAALTIGLGDLSDAEASQVFWTVCVLIIVSIVVHGITATPLSRRWLEGHKQPERT